MTKLWTSAAIADATGGTASAPFAASGVTFDSREVQPGDLFIALAGTASDGHAFAAAALAAGAAGVLCQRAVDGPHVLVDDTLAALRALGVAARARCRGRIVGITGSVGKTGTKEALFAALDRSKPGRAHRSVKSYNNHTGVPLSLARMPATSRYAVLEMGMNHAGEIADLAAMVRPHVAVITTIAPAHIENLGSIEAIADAKAEIFGGLEPDGIAILPFDSPWFDRLAAAARAQGAEVISFGLNAGADVHALDWLDNGHGGSLITARVRGTLLCFTLGQAGDHWVANAMAVLAAVQAVGGDLAAAGVALAEMGGLAGRGARHQLDWGDGRVLLIDESYNANPASMAATIAQLGVEPARRKVAVLGAMRELGVGSDAYHAALAQHLIAAGVAKAILVGAEMQPLAEALTGSVDRIAVADADAAWAALDDALAPGDAVLVKGSNSVGLSRVVARLTAARHAAGGR